MDDIRRPSAPDHTVAPASRSAQLTRRSLCVGLGMGLLMSQSGCSFFTMAGKVFFGDPVVNCEFTQSTGNNLLRTKDRVLVVSSAPSAVKAHYPSLEIDIQDGVTRRLHRQGIQTVDSDDVSSWLDDHGGTYNDIDQLAEDFDANFIIEVQLHRFTHYEDNSSKLYRGHVQADISVYQVTDNEEFTQALPVFSREFTMQYPKNYAVSVDEKSDVVFQKEYLDRVVHAIAMRFYNHRVSEEVE